MKDIVQVITTMKHTYTIFLITLICYLCTFLAFNVKADDPYLTLLKILLASIDVFITLTLSMILYHNDTEGLKGDD